MKFCSTCGKEIMDEAIVCPGCGCSVSGANKPVAQSAEEDTVSIGLCVLAALVPLFGIIYWPLKYKTVPKKAKACGITAIVSWGVSIIFSVIFGVVSSVLMMELL